MTFVSNYLCVFDTSSCAFAGFDLFEFGLGRCGSKSFGFWFVTVHFRRWCFLLGSGGSWGRRRHGGFGCRGEGWRRGIGFVLVLGSHWWRNFRHWLWYPCARQRCLKHTDKPWKSSKMLPLRLLKYHWSSIQGADLALAQECFARIWLVELAFDWKSYLKINIGNILTSGPGPSRILLLVISFTHLLVIWGVGRGHWLRSIAENY